MQAWTSLYPKTRATSLSMTPTSSVKNTVLCTSAKDTFLSSLDTLDRLNTHHKDRTRLLQEMIDSRVEIPIQDYLKDSTSTNNVSIQNPGQWESMQMIAQGTWKVIYAPHMTIMAGLAGGGTLDVSYILQEDGTMISHAVCDFSWLPNNGKIILSVSGTWGSVSSQVCRVDFDQAWITLDQEEPFATFNDVPDDGKKSIISFLGRLFFIEAVSVFPISFLDDNLIVFDFELLGTRICARKI